jgi:hypothetical protein
MSMRQRAYGAKAHAAPCAGTPATWRQIGAKSHGCKLLAGSGLLPNAKFTSVGLRRLTGQFPCARLEGWMPFRQLQDVLDAYRRTIGEQYGGWHMADVLMLFAHCARTSQTWQKEICQARGHGTDRLRLRTETAPTTGPSC